jgi:hypothetical protein
MNSSVGLDAASRDIAVRILGQRLSARDLRAVLDAEVGQGRRRKSVEWIVAETEHTSGRLRPRLPDQDLAAFLGSSPETVPIIGADRHSRGTRP